MELVKELKPIKERQAKSDCTGFASVKKQGCFKILGRKKGKNVSNYGPSNFFLYGARFRTDFEEESTQRYEGK